MRLHHLSAPLLVVLLLGAAGAQAATAADARLANGRSVHGMPVSAPQDARVVDVGTRSVLNVDCGDTITFVNGDQRFSWKFDSVGHGAVDLRALAPAGFASQRLMVYVSRNEAERS
jgi:plastocyanin